MLDIINEILKRVARQSQFIWRSTGLYWRMRFRQSQRPTLDDIKSMSRDLTSNTTDYKRPVLTDRVVVIGSGVGAFSFVKKAKSSGFKQIVLIQGDPDQVGGTCVNAGCMPSEFFLAQAHLRPQELIQRFRNFRLTLRQHTAKTFAAACSEIIPACAVGITGKNVILDNGQKVAFDFAVLANGRNDKISAEWPSALTLEDFWAMESGAITIIVDQNLTGLSLASMARERGLIVRVVFVKSIPMSHLPSVTYWGEQLTQLGIQFKVAMGIETVNATQVVFYDLEGKKINWQHQGYMQSGRPALSSLPVDGKELTPQDIDYRTLNLGPLKRTDIFVVGDAATFLSASEAELSAEGLVESWLMSSRDNGRPFYDRPGNIVPELTPVRLHGQPSLAMVGTFSSYLESEWRSVDFSNLGWSAVHQKPGAAWYLFDRRSGYIQAIHICHPDATELIGLAAVLLHHSVFDTVWSTCFVHPSSTEIFRLIRADATSQLDDQKMVWRPTPAILKLPVHMLHSDAPSIHLPQLDRTLAQIDHDPKEFSLVTAAVRATGHRDANGTVQRDAQGRLTLRDGSSIDYVYHPQALAAVVSLRGQTVHAKFE